MRILFFGENPEIATGLAHISKHLLNLFTLRGDSVETVFTNSKPRDNYNLTAARERVLNAEYDLLFMSQDVHVLNSLQEAIHQRKENKDFTVIAYSTLDCDVFPRECLDCLENADIPVVYSLHSKEAATRIEPSLDGKLRTVYLGCEPDVFYPLSSEARRELRREIFNIEDDNTFLVLWLNRNQWRKDPARALAIFHRFHQEVPNSLLYMHTRLHDLGGKLWEQAKCFDMTLSGPGTEVIFTDTDFNERTGVSRERLNQVYNCADCYISTSTGEGFGLTTTEAMAAGCPVIVPRNTSFIEIVGKHQQRGYLVTSGGNDNWMVPYGVSDNPRPTVHQWAMLSAMSDVYHLPSTAKVKAERARAWTLEHTWQHAMDEWQQILKEVEP